jgi:glycosyltransferase involved in cell wall biosynthesis
MSFPSDTPVIIAPRINLMDMVKSSPSRHPFPLFISASNPENLSVKISVVIPAFNEEKLITGTLRSINAARKSFTDAGWESEIIVCDNNSTDRTGDLARAEGAVVVFEPINQIGRARNKGAEAAAGDWLLFVDGDSQPSPELFADVVATIQTGRCLAGGATVVLDHANLVARLIIGGWNRISRFNRWVAGSFIFCETAAFRALGGFSHELFAGEELDLSKRLNRLARGQGKQVVILDRHPLVTSNRKMHLYSPWEHIRFLARTVLSRGRTMKTRDQCQIWYDGRR